MADRSQLITHAALLLNLLLVVRQVSKTTADYSQLPPGAVSNFTPFKSNVPDAALSRLKQLIELSNIGAETYENLRSDGQFGITRKWLINAQKYWANEWSWRDVESEFNSFPSFTVPIKARDGDTYTVHFIALFSKRADAKPIAFYHGWPGSVFEFLKLLAIIREKWPSPEELPWHVVVPSFPGYAFSSGPSKTVEWTTEDIAYVTNELMLGLGFSDYIAQGGDVGSFVARISAVRYDACRAITMNLFVFAQEPPGVDPKDVTAMEAHDRLRAIEFGTYEDAYMKEQGTKGGTIGLVLSSSPLALLGWIGEKFLKWSDVKPSLKEILDSVSLYWLTDTYPRCIYPYIDFAGRGANSTFFTADPRYYCKKPMGYSYFSREQAPVPVAWAATSGDLIWYRRHATGGHFAAMEKPRELVQDLEDFIKVLDG